MSCTPEPGVRTCARFGSARFALGRVGSRRCAIASMGAVLAWATVARAGPADPLPSIDLSPLRQLVYQHPNRGPLPAEPEGTLDGEARIGYFAAFSSQDREDSSILIDLEGARFDLRLGWAPLSGIEVGFDLPLLVYYDGVLDAVVEVVDRAVGTPSPQRKDLGQNTYHFRHQHGNDRPFEPAPGHFGFGDAALEVRGRCLDEDAEGWLPEVSVSGVAEVPTGDPGLAHGNGAVDVGGEVEAARTFGPVRLTTAFGFVVPGGSPGRLEGVSTRVAVNALLAFGYGITDTWQALAQVDYRQSPYRGSQLDVLKADSAELAVGLRFEPPGGVAFDLGFVEGLVNGSSPDFAVVTSVSRRFDGGSDPAP